jgi:RND family efflux transporter MFP subunit
MKTLFLVSLALLAAGAVAWHLTAAPAASQASPSPEPPELRITAEGRVMPYPGAEINVSSELPGTIVDLPVDEKSTVHKGQLLCQIRCDEQQAMLAEANARIAEAQAEMKYEDIEVKRLTELVAHFAGSRDELDRDRWQYAAAQARSLAASATAARISSVLDKMHIVSPIDGTILARHVQPGETINASQQLLTIADLSRARIEAEVDEFDAGRIALSAPVTFTAEGYPDMVWKGHVEQIPDAVIDRQTRPEDPGKPSDTRILLVKICFDQPTPLKLRQRVEVTIEGKR